jgi:UDP-2,4-diacetamido-2,4,6-trideoxy-beta-L-altropyranose hydrolase
MKVAIRADASREIGTGHLMRCLTLADALAATGADAIFLCAPSSVPWYDVIEAHGHRHATLSAAAPAEASDASSPHAGLLPWSQESDAAAMLDALSTPVDWLIVDHYGLDHRWEQIVRRRSGRILAIDDLADRAHDCDVLLDQNGQNGGSDRYDGLVPADAVRLLGPRYALLRSSFAAARAQREPPDGSVRRISVFMGGTDSAGASNMALAALSRRDLSRIAVDVMVGGKSVHRDELESAAESRGGTGIHVDVPDPAELLAATDLAIGAGGVAALERCCLGLPTVSVAVADNQVPGLAWLARAGAVRHLGALDAIDERRLADEISALCGAPDEIKSMAARAGALVDGFGTPRVVRILRGPRSGVAVRTATMDDAWLLHRWRDDPAVRAISMTSAPIPYADHCRWLTQALQDPDHIVLVAMLGQHPVGSLRYRLHDGEAAVSIVIAPEMRGEGVGGELLDAGEAHLKATYGGPLRIVATVKPDNRASMRLFAGSGFEVDVAEPSRMLYGKRVG